MTFQEFQGALVVPDSATFDGVALQLIAATATLESKEDLRRSAELVAVLAALTDHSENLFRRGSVQRQDTFASAVLSAQYLAEFIHEQEITDDTLPATIAALDDVAMLSGYTLEDCL